MEHVNDNDSKMKCWIKLSRRSFVATQGVLGAGVARPFRIRKVGGSIPPGSIYRHFMFEKCLTVGLGMESPQFFRTAVRPKISTSFCRDDKCSKFICK